VQVRRVEHRRGRGFKTSTSGRNRIDAIPVPVRKNNIRTGIIIGIEQRNKPVMGPGPVEAAVRGVNPVKVVASVDPDGARTCMIHPEGRLV
jgi:hypothetical protein